METRPCYATMFTKVSNYCDFLFAYLELEAFSKGASLREENLLLQEQIFSLLVDPRFPLKREANA